MEVVYDGPMTTTSDFTVSVVERRSRLNGTEGWFARVETAEFRIECSQMPTDEPGTWGVDAMFKSNGWPIHANGFGARYCIVHRAAADIERALNARVAAA